MDAEEVLEALYTMSDGESDGGEISKASWVGSASDGSYDSDQDIIFRCFSLKLLKCLNFGLNI